MVRANINAGHPAKLRNFGNVSTLCGRELCYQQVQDFTGKLQIFIYISLFIK